MWNEKSEQSNEIKTSTTKSGRTGKKRAEAQKVSVREPRESGAPV